MTFQITVVFNAMLDNHPSQTVTRVNGDSVTPNAQEIDMHEVILQHILLDEFLTETHVTCEQLLPVRRDANTIKLCDCVQE